MAGGESDRRLQGRHSATGRACLYSSAVPGLPRIAPVVALALCALVAPATAQHPPLGSPEPRPLHVQLALADAAVLARVDSVAPGRVQLVEARALLGDVPAEPALKRAPSSPPPLDPGDLALLLLRGARTPYLLASEPHEVIRLSDAASLPAWRAGLRALSRAGSHEDVAHAYLAWLGSASERLQLESVIGLAHADVPASALTPVAARLAMLALEGSEGMLRRFSARAAARTGAGRALLLAGLPTHDPEVLDATLAQASTAELGAASPTLLRALRHEDAGNRSVALRYAARVEGDREIVAQLVRISSEDPDERLREQARSVMKLRAHR